MSRILVVGVPRSGTSWVGTVLGRTKGAVYLEEPDNHLRFPFALRAKRWVPGGHYPALAADDEASDYEMLWQNAFAMDEGRNAAEFSRRERAQRLVAFRLLRSARKEQIWRALSQPDRVAPRLRAAQALAIPERPPASAEHLVVKSVYAPLTVEWIAARFPTMVVIVLRDLLNVLSSWVELDWLGRPGDDILDTFDPLVQEQLAADFGLSLPEAGGSPLSHAAWLLGLLTYALKDAADRHPDWHVVAHEDLCRSPSDRFRELAGKLGLSWSVAEDRLLEEMNGSGRGSETFRVASGLPQIWRSRLDPNQVREIAAVLEAFPFDRAGTAE